MHDKKNETSIGNMTRIKHTQMHKKNRHYRITRTALLVWLSLFTALKIEAQIVSATATSLNIANAVIYVDTADFALVKKSTELLQHDIEMVTGKKPAIVNGLSPAAKTYIIIGTSGHSKLIDALATAGAINLSSISNKWEAYQLQTINSSNTSKLLSKGTAAFIISGSDRRGTAYGVFELSKQMGVSPWYWWADVPVKKQSNIYINTSLKISDAPKVKYRGFFINDEAPCLSNWSKATFGGFNHLFYEKVFELLIRLKANYLWPAMWGNAFNTDDPLNNVLADEYGIVMGTSHHEPMLRAQQEWKKFGKGAWDYTKNDTVLRAFWKKGIENMKSHENILTIGMRGDGDMPMTQGTATELLERIVADQRKIIEEVTHKPASETPQLWALYKEVQEYYDKGMRVPDDVTLLLCDDNWGNIRKLPKPTDKPHPGGYGIYYHFDYVGGPRNYKWLNTNSLPKVWEQMHLAYEHDVKNIWIVNVGDIKPMEYPISFFLEYAWNPDRIGAADITSFSEKWAAAQFGKQYAKEIAEILSAYTKYNSRRKPELVDANTYNLKNNEWATVVNDYNDLLKKAEAINQKLAAEFKDAYFQLVLHPVKACANLNEMYYNAALNKQAYAAKWKEANVYADKVKQLYKNDSLITLEYHQLNNGKWKYMMSQTHIGYFSWQEPRQQRMPLVKYVPADSIQASGSADIPAPVQKAVYPANSKYNLFYEQNHFVSIGADHYTKAVNANGITWKILPDHGRTGSAITTFPVTAKEQQPGKSSPYLEYEFYTYSNGSFSINCYFSPTLNFYDTPNGLQYAVSVDDELPQIISMNVQAKTNEGINYKWVGDNIIIKQTNHKIVSPGKHVVRYWMVNSAVVLQKLVLDFGNPEQSYLGPVETKNINN